jgi:glutathione S-transferase
MADHLLKQTATKAWVGAALAAVAAALAVLRVALGDGVVSSEEAVDIALAALLGSGLTGAGVFLSPRNKDKY